MKNTVYDDRWKALDTVIRITDGIANEIETMPTVDAEPVLHGKWIFNREMYSWECSECHYRTDSIFDESKSNYCPNCGCEMDGE